MHITHLGHACLLVESAGVRLLLDPGGFSHGFEELSDLDAVLVTHRHADHLDVERLAPLLESNDAADLVAEPETAAELQHAGLDARPLHPGESATLGSARSGSGVRLTGVGGRHAVIHQEIPRVGNIGMLIAADEEPTLFHPGDTYEYAPAGVDVLAVPLNAPWAAVKETIEFVRAVAPAIAFPIHDALLMPFARDMYLGHVDRLSPEATQIRDLAGAGASEMGRG